jgi:hypothetical protein
VKLICAMILLLVACDLAMARSVPLPRPRPAPPAVAASAVMPSLSETPQPSPCRLRLTSDIATAPSLPPITGPGECEAPDVVRLEAVVLFDRSRVAITPPAILRCTMAEAIAGWVREEAAPRALDLGSSLKAVENFTSFDCHGRNGIAGAKLSEHGKANALDIHSLRLANGKVVKLTDPHVPKDFREGLRKSACAQFTTPGTRRSNRRYLRRSNPGLAPLLESATQAAVVKNQIRPLNLARRSPHRENAICERQIVNVVGTMTVIFTR